MEHVLTKFMDGKYLSCSVCTPLLGARIRNHPDFIARHAKAVADGLPAGSFTDTFRDQF